MVDYVLIMKALKHLNKYFFKYRYRLIVGIIITIFAKIFVLFTPRFVGASIDLVDEKFKPIFAHFLRERSGHDSS